MSWIEAQALYDIGLKQIKTGLENIQKAHDIMERLNEKEEKQEQIADHRRSGNPHAKIRPPQSGR